MKSSQPLIHWLKKVLVLAIVLGMIGWVRPVSVSATTEFNERIVFTDDFDACTGERVTIDGVQHIVGRFTRDANGKLHFGFNRNTKGTGIGQESGDSYILADTVHRTSLEVVPGEPHVFTEGYQAMLKRHGEEVSGDDSVIHFLSRITVSANGDVTASIEIQNFECQ